MEARKMHQLDIDGHSFHVVEQGAGPVVLFCHGFPDIAATWYSQVAAVAEAGYRAIALDMRGFGGSHAPREASQYTALHVVGDLVGVLDALGVDSAVLVGHDWGGDIAWKAALMRPDRFRAVVSLSIPYAPRGALSHFDGLRKDGLAERSYYFRMIQPEMDARFEPAARSIPSALYWLSHSPAPEERWSPNDPARHMLRPSPVEVPDWAPVDYARASIAAFDATGFHTGLNYYRAVQPTFDLTPAFKGALVRQPSLYIYGAADGLVEVFHPEPPTLEALRAAAPGLVDVIRLEDIGHWIQHEAAERVNAELVKFLGRLDRA